MFDAAWFITMANSKSVKTHMSGGDEKGGEGNGVEKDNEEIWMMSDWE